MQKYSIVTFATLSGVGHLDNKCIIKSDYKYIPTSNTFKLIDNALYHTDKFITSSDTYTATDNDQTVILTDEANEFPVVVNSHVFTLTIDCDQIKQQSDPGTEFTEKKHKIIKIIYNFGDNTPEVVIDRKLSYDSNKSDIEVISIDGDIWDPRLQKVKHTYYVSGNTTSTINTTVTIIYADGTENVNTIKVTCNEFSIENTFNSINLLDVCAFNDQYNRETCLLSFELGEGTAINPNHISTVALYNE